MTDMTRINWDGRAFFSPSAGIVVTPAEPEEAQQTDTATQAFQAGAQQAAAEHAAAKQDAAEKQVVSQYAQAGQQVLQNGLLGQLPTQGEIARQTWNTATQRGSWERQTNTWLHKRRGIPPAWKTRTRRQTSSASRQRNTALI